MKLKNVNDIITNENSLIVQQFLLTTTHKVLKMLSETKQKSL